MFDIGQWLCHRAYHHKDSDMDIELLLHNASICLELEALLYRSMATINF